MAMYASDIAHLLHWEQEEILDLVLYALWHDAEEAFTGDTPGPVKRMLYGPQAKEVVEAEFVRRFGFHRTATPRQLVVIKIADLIDEYLYLSDEIHMGNTAVSALLDSVRARLQEAWYRLPLPHDDLFTIYHKHLRPWLHVAINGPSDIMEDNRDIHRRETP